MTTSRSEPRPARFAPSVRTFHWVTAALFGVCMTTGAVLYAGQLSALVGNREIVRALHVWSGLAIPAVFVLTVALPWGRALRAELRALDRWPRGPEPGRFGRGQRVNAALVMGATAVMVATGVIMRWYEPFPLDWRTGATFVHDWFALFLWADVAGHIWMAFRHPAALDAMLRGGPGPGPNLAG